MTKRAISFLMVVLGAAVCLGATASGAVPFEVGKAQAEVVLGGLEQVYDGTPKGVTVETVPAGLAVAVTYDGQEAAPGDAGRYQVVATVLDDSWTGHAEGTLVIAKGQQYILFGDVETQVATNRLWLDAEASSGLQVSYEVEGPAEMESWNSMRFLGAGTVRVTASQEGDDNWEAAVSASFSFEVVKAVAEVRLSGLEQVYDGTEKLVEVTTEPEGLWMTVRYDSEHREYDWPIDAGEYAVTVTVEDDYFEGGATGTLRVAKASLGEREPGGGTVPEGGLSAFDTTAVYDGWGHPIDVGALEAAFAEAMNREAFTVEYTMEGNYPDYAVWEDWPPYFTNACEETVWYRVSSSNYEDFVHAARVTVTPRPVEVRVWGTTRTYEYNGQEKMAEGFGLETVDELFDVHGMTRFGGTAEARRTDAGKTPMGLAVVDFECTDANFEATYVIEEDGYVEVVPADIGTGEWWTFRVELGASPKYDGTERTVEVASATWWELPVTFEVEGNTAVDAGWHTMTVTGTGNFTGTRTAEWEILRRQVTLTSADASKERYDGEALTAHEIIVGGDGWAEGEGAEYIWWGAAVGAGDTINTFGYVLKDGTKDANYDIETVFGTLHVGFADISEEGAFEAVVANPVYDGTEQTAEVKSVTWEGLDVTFAVVGNQGTHAGGYEMRLIGVGEFTGERKMAWAIEPRPVTLESAGATKPYDGTALEKDAVSVAEGSLGFAEGEGFTAVCTGSQTAVGESENAFRYELAGGTLAGDYKISTVYGVLKVTLGVVDPVAVFGAERPVCEKEYNRSGQAFEMAVEFGEPWQLLYADGDGGFGETAPVLTHVEESETEVAFRFESANYEAYEGTAGFRITQAANDWMVQPGIAGWTEGEAASEPTGEARFGALEVAYRAKGAAVENETGEPPAAAGLYVARFWVSETADYAGLGEDEACEVEFAIATVAEETTQTTEVPLPLSWLEPYVEQYGDGDYEAAGKAVGKNGYALWESYVAGLDPDDADSRLTPVIQIRDDGTPEVTWKPDWSGDEALPREYTVVGTDALEKGVEEWETVTDENIGEMKFFAVSVRLADSGGKEGEGE